MIFWIIAILITIICLFAFYLSTNNKANQSDDSKLSNEIKDEIGTPSNVYFKRQLRELEKDIKSGLISEAEADAAKAELAREMLRHKAELSKKHGEKGVNQPLLISTPEFLLSLIIIAGLAFSIYYFLGSPNLPANPLALRTTPEAQMSEVITAIEQVEARLEQNPDDARGWSVLAPIYMQMQRYDDAVIALRNVDRLLSPNADVKTDLAEALMMANDGVTSDEIIDLLKTAKNLDPKHVRSRFYLAGEAMRAGDNEGAIKQWQEILALSTGDEQWVDIVREGIEEAQARIDGKTQPPQQPQTPQQPQQDAPINQSEADDQAAFINQMVERLETRLATDGGTLEEWTQLVRSLLVLGNKEKAQKVYSEAKQNFPNEQQRIELDKLATDAGLQ